MYKSLLSFDEEDYKATGITFEIMNMFRSISAAPKGLYRDESNAFHPVVYFDRTTNFTFHFTKFQGDWSDQSQINRFAQQWQLAKHQINPIN